MVGDILLIVNREGVQAAALLAVFLLLRLVPGLKQEGQPIFPAMRRSIALVFTFLSAAIGLAAKVGGLNVLFITLDDMNRDSVPG